MAKSMMGIKFISDTAGVDYLWKHAEDIALPAVHEATQSIHDYIREHWSSSSPSSPGNPPAVVTGYLDQSIKIERRDALGRFAIIGNAVSYLIKVEADYALALEFGNSATNLQARPFFIPAVRAVEEQLGIKLTVAFRTGIQRASVLSKATFLSRQGLG